MDFENKLIPGVLIKRYKRFFVDIKLKNKTITAHCPNPGSMINLLDKGNQVWITKSTNPDRKLQYTLQIIKANKIKICINTHITNKIVQESINNKLIKEIKDFNIIRPEKTFGKNTRFDFLLHNNKTDKKAFLEVKSVSLQRRKDHAEFPDSVAVEKKTFRKFNKRISTRLWELSHVSNSNEKSKSFSIAADIDPEYYKVFNNALKKM